MIYPATGQLARAAMRNRRKSVRNKKIHGRCERYRGLGGEKQSARREWTISGEKSPIGCNAKNGDAAA